MHVAAVVRLEQADEGEVGELAAARRRRRLLEARGVVRPPHQPVQARQHDVHLAAVGDHRTHQLVGGRLDEQVVDAPQLVEVVGAQDVRARPLQVRLLADEPADLVDDGQVGPSQLLRRRQLAEEHHVEVVHVLGEVERAAAVKKVLQTVLDVRQAEAAADVLRQYLRGRVGRLLA